MRIRIVKRALLGCLVAGSFATPTLVAAQQAGADVSPTVETLREEAFPSRPYSPYAGRNFPTRPLFGDTHLHTAFSMDAGAMGARLSPRDAYRFAMGEEVTASSNQRAKLSRITTPPEVP
jgi:hypothetical protein